MKNKFKKICMWAFSIIFFETLAFFIYLPFMSNKLLSVLLFLVIHIIALFAIEYIFRFFYQRRAGRPYTLIPKIPFDRIFIESHPYLPYVNKENFQSQKQAASNYPLHGDLGFYFKQLTTNNFRHNDGPEGNRPIIIPKPESQYRVLCLGASTTGNYLCYNGNVYSYPMELEKILQKEFPDRNIVVHNCGTGGWTSAEILIDFLLTLYDVKPDLVLVYHAYNDLGDSLTAPFKSDYSHSRKNLGESLHLYKLATYIPYFSLAIYNSVINAFFPYTNARFGILEAIRKSSPNIKNDFNGLSTYRRNIEHLVKVCKASNIDIVLSSFAHFLYKDVKNDPLHEKYGEGVKLENEAMKSLAMENNLNFVDNYTLIPKEEKYFVDTIHFTPDGMTLLAQNFAKAATEIIGSKSTN